MSAHKLKRRFALAIAALALADPAASAGKPAHDAQPNCSTGPYAVKLSKSYKAVRKLAPIKKEGLLKTEDRGRYKAEYHLLSFDGLELIVITISNAPDRYVLSSATVTSPNWNLTGRFRVGNSAAFALQGLPVKSIQANGEVSLGDGKDSIRLTLYGGHIKQIDYDCHIGQMPKQTRKSGARR